MQKNFLRKIREEKNIGQSELAAQVGVSKQLLSGFEKGRSGVSNEVLQKLAKALGVSSDHIIGGVANNPFDEKGLKKLSEAMSITFKFFGDEFDKETMVKIATELYGILIDFERSAAEVGKKNFKKSLEEKIITGLAAKCFLGSKHKKLWKKTKKKLLAKSSKKFTTIVLNGCKQDEIYATVFRKL